MAATAIDDAKRFLFLHPSTTTELENPVEIIASLIQEIDSLNDHINHVELERNRLKASLEKCKRTTK